MGAGYKHFPCDVIIPMELSASEISWNVFPASLNGIAKGWSFAANVLVAEILASFVFLMFLDPAVP